MTNKPSFSQRQGITPVKYQLQIDLMDAALKNSLWNALELEAKQNDTVCVLHRRAADIDADSMMLLEKVENVQEHRRLEEKVKRIWDGSGRGKSAAGRVASKLNQQRARAAVGSLQTEKG